MSVYNDQSVHDIYNQFSMICIKFYFFILNVCGLFFFSKSQKQKTINFLDDKATLILNIAQGLIYMFSISYIVHYLIIMFVRTMKHGLKTLGFTYTNNMNLINRIGTIQWHYKGLMNHVNIIVYCKPTFICMLEFFLKFWKAILLRTSP